jgi:putative tryptophan/tyrosine transport system substrate-binding protein
VLDVEEAEHGVLAGLREAGLVEGRDYEVKIRNAQGDMGTVNSLIDAAVSDGADLLITLSTPTLQVALQRARTLPIVFTYVANGVIAGAGRSDEDHLPNVTGVYLGGGYEELLAIVRESFPFVRTMGTLFVPSEVNSVFHKDLLVEAARKIGIEVVAVAASTSAEVPDAALSLCSRQIDALCQIPGNLTASSFPSIAQAARRVRLPIFAFQSSQARGGAAVVLARDYGDGGREAGLLAARIMRGESPAVIPFQLVSRTKLIVNLEAARGANLRLPAALIKRADEVIGQ